MKPPHALKPPAAYAASRFGKVLGVGLALFTIYVMGYAHADQCQALLGIVLNFSQLQAR